MNAADALAEAGVGFDVMSLSSGGGASASSGGGGGGGGGGVGNFQFASLDEVGGLLVWTGIGLGDVDTAGGSEADPGLAPGARVKLVRSATLRDPNTNAPPSHIANNLGLPASIGLQSFDVQFKPDETNEYILALGKGQLRRGRRYGVSFHTRARMIHTQLARLFACVLTLVACALFFLRVSSGQSSSIRLLSSSIHHAAR